MSGRVSEEEGGGHLPTHCVKSSAHFLPSFCQFLEVKGGPCSLPHRSIYVRTADLAMINGHILYI